MALTMFRTTALAVCSSALLLAGCGGSDGGGGGGGGLGAAPTAEITRDNAGDIADAAYDSNDSVGGVGDVPGKILFSANELNELPLTGLLGHVVDLIDLPGKGSGIGPMLHLGDSCDTSGSASLSLQEDDSSGELDQEGESLTVSFDNCLDGVGEPIINGSMTMTLDDLSENSFAFTMSFNNLSISGGAQMDDILANGSLSFGFSLTENPATIVFEMSGSNLSLTEGGQPVGLTGSFEFTVTLILEGPNAGSMVEFDMQIEIDSATGTVNIETTQPLVGDPPESGVVVVEGANGTITITATGGGNATVTVDENSDGTIECSQDLTFNTLDLFDPMVACI